MDNTINLGWGNSVCVRKAFLSNLRKGQLIVFGEEELLEMNYPPHDGDLELIEITKKVIERQTGATYKHVFLTNGAAGGVTISLRAFQQMGYNTAYTRSPPYFPIYPSMIKVAGLKHVLEGGKRESGDKTVALIDSPTNPGGRIVERISEGLPIIWDAVYYNKVYVRLDQRAPIVYPKVLIGSYSKLIGLNGLRTGWVATNDDLLAPVLREIVTAEYCGLSSASTTILLNLLGRVKWAGFENTAKGYLDDNREEWSKLEKYFSSEVPVNGMFHYTELDAACKKLLEKSNIVWTSGSSLGASDDFGRFNLGQDRDLIKQAVKTILKNDKI